MIERWRRLERELYSADPDGAHFLGLQIEIQRQRYEYQRLLAEARHQADRLRETAGSSMRVVARSVAAAESSRATLRRVRGDVRTRSRTGGD